MTMDMTANMMMMTLTIFDSLEACTAVNIDEQEVPDSDDDDDDDDVDDDDVDDDDAYHAVNADGTRRGGLRNMQ